MWPAAEPNFLGGRPRPPTRCATLTADSIPPGPSKQRKPPADSAPQAKATGLMGSLGAPLGPVRAQAGNRGGGAACASADLADMVDLIVLAVETSAPKAVGRSRGSAFEVEGTPGAGAK
mmetsp:Transcript_63136/g.142397  ORF Transcript_63136/g.142397 Transcript_63136/m.142397 type:complete len:119 (-) Transcript_63136:288-644(-)